MVLKIGTNNKQAIPIIKTVFLSKEVEPKGSFFCSGGMKEPFIFILINRAGTTKQTSDGRIVLIMILPVVIWFPIQSMVVVTSPIGLQAPPAFAEITTSPANISLSL